MPPTSPDSPTEPPASFAGYQAENYRWITIIPGEYYPDSLPTAVGKYAPVVAQFGQLLQQATSSQDLLQLVMSSATGAARTQLLRVFRRYVAPDFNVETSKRQSIPAEHRAWFGEGFRDLVLVHAAYAARPVPDEALCVLLHEYGTRGLRGYQLTTHFFALGKQLLPGMEFQGPHGAGADIPIRRIFSDFPQKGIQLDIVIGDGATHEVLAVGLAHYDSDRGGGQERDRLAENSNTAREVLDYTATHDLRTKVIFLNDGPGLLAGKMWWSYNDLEARHPGQVRVMTLKMVPARLTEAWLRS